MKYFILLLFVCQFTQAQLLDRFIKFPSTGTTNVMVQISASNQDAEEQTGGAVSFVSLDLEMAYDPTLQQWVGVLFASANIPATNTINTATIQFVADAGTAQSGTPSLTIKAQKGTTPAVFTTATSSISTRPLTTASVAWSPTGWTSGEAGTDQETPDLSTIIQEVVNDGSYTSTDPIVFVITGTGTNFVRAEAYDGIPASAATLNVNYDD